MQRLAPVPTATVAAVAQLPLCSVQDILDAHLLDREQAGDRRVLPVQAVYLNDQRIYNRAAMQVKPGDVVAYGDASALHIVRLPVTD